MYAYEENDECLTPHGYTLCWTLIYGLNFFTSLHKSTTTTNKDYLANTINQQLPTAGQSKEQLITGDT